MFHIYSDFGVAVVIEKNLRNNFHFSMFINTLCNNKYWAAATHTLSPSLTHTQTHTHTHTYNMEELWTTFITEFITF